MKQVVARYFGLRKLGIAPSRAWGRAMWEEHFEMEMGGS